MSTSQEIVEISPEFIEPITPNARQVLTDIASTGVTTVNTSAATSVSVREECTALMVSSENNEIISLINQVKEKVDDIDTSCAANMSVKNILLLRWSPKKRIQAFVRDMETKGDFVKHIQKSIEEDVIPRMIKGKNKLVENADSAEKEVEVLSNLVDTVSKSIDYLDSDRFKQDYPDAKEAEIKAVKERLLTREADCRSMIEVYAQFSLMARQTSTFYDSLIDTAVRTINITLASMVMGVLLDHELQTQERVRTALKEVRNINSRLTRKNAENFRDRALKARSYTEVIDVEAIEYSKSVIKTTLEEISKSSAENVKAVNEVLNRLENMNNSLSTASITA